MADNEQQTLSKNFQKLTSALKVSDKKKDKTNNKVRLDEEFSKVIDNANSQIQLLKNKEDDDSFTNLHSEKRT